MQTEPLLAEVNVVQIYANSVRLTNHNVLENVKNTVTNAVSDQVRIEGEAVDWLDRLTMSHHLYSHEPAISRILDDTAILWFGVNRLL